MTRVSLYRHQYGVGQGCFHAQEVSFTEMASSELTYRFVYDCGSSSSKKTLEWCVSHFASGAMGQAVDAVYISHFEFDHVNGMKALCNATDVKRIYAPHINFNKAIHIVAQQVAAGVSWTTEFQEYVVSVFDIAQGASIFDVPVTLVGGGDQPGAIDETPVPQGEDGDIWVSAPTGASISHSQPIVIATRSKDKSGKQTGEVAWEFVHWYYGADSRLTAGILAEMAQIVDFKTQMEPGFQRGADAAARKKALAWIATHYRDISEAYRTAMQSQNAVRIAEGHPALPDNHNVASLCLYSGPRKDYGFIRSYAAIPATGHCVCEICYRIGLFDEPHARFPGWIGTGDALLKIDDVWDAFEKHFTARRIDRCSTVLIPHHGADARESRNFNEKLIRERQCCVITAGLKNSYNHPHKNVVQRILTKPAHLFIVNETEPIGFVEQFVWES